MMSGTEPVPNRHKAIRSGRDRGEMILKLSDNSDAAYDSPN